MTSPTYKPLTILLWNSNGIQLHRNELTTLLQDKNVDIALITETHLTSRTNVFIPGYITHRTDHPDNTAHGGSAILIRSSISHYPDPSPTSLECLQSTTITLQSSTRLPITVSSVYCPPNKSVSVDTLGSFLSSLGPRFIAGGDYNAKHAEFGCRITNSRGRTFQTVLQSRRLKVVSQSRPTYWPTSRSKLPDIVDYFITNGLNHVPYDISNLLDLSSDHSPLLLSLNTDANQYSSNTRPSLIHGPVDWLSFQTFLNSSLNLNLILKTREDVDLAVNKITTDIQTAIWNSSNHSVSHHHSKPEKPILPPHIQQLRTKKNRARRIWQRTRYPSDKTRLNLLTRQLQDALRTLYNDRFADYTKQLNSDERSLWTATNRILSSRNSVYPLRREDNTWAKSDEEIANTFANHLSNIFNPHEDTLEPNHCAFIREQLDVPLPLSLPPSPFHPKEVSLSISKLPKHKAPGFDLITPTILKHLPKKAILFLTLIYNASLRTTYFPLLWKFSTIKMIHKPGKTLHSPSSYRPISLLPIMGKILEKLLLKRIHCIINPILPPHQFGFRFSHSTIHQCHRIVDSISQSFENREYCSGVFLDVAQAFDRVWHQGLLFKLKSYLPSTFYLLIRSYLSERFFNVSFGSASSITFPQHSGVPQGSILSPILFLAYTADIPIHPSTSIFSFADDTAILSSSPCPVRASNNLQEHLKLLEPWLTKWKFKVNSDKSSHITFALRRSSCPSVYLFQKIIPVKTQIKYLGIILDKRLTWSPHITSKRQITYRRYKQLLRLLDKRSKLSLHNKRRLYTAILQPTWTYAIEVWGSAKPSNIRRIQSLQSKILRKIVNAPFYVSNLTLHTDLSIPFVQTLARSRYTNFHSRLPGHENPFINALSSISHPTQRRLRRNWPRDLLNL